MKRNPVALYSYLVVLSLCAIALVTWLVMDQPLTGQDLIPLVCFLVFVIGVEFFDIKTLSGGYFVPSSTIYLAVIALFGPSFAAILHALVLVIGDGLIKRRPLIKTVFNLAALSIVTGVAGLVFHRMPFSNDLSSPLYLIPALVAHIVFSSLSMVLASIVIGLSEGVNVRTIWKNNYGWHFLSSIVAAPLSAFLIFSYSYAGLWSLLLFAMPLYSIWRSHKLFEDMKEAHKNTVAALTTALEADEPYTHGHSYRVARYAITLGQELGMSAKELESLEYAGLLHDIGKIAITNDIVCKPARLTKEEFDILAAHPAIGGEIVSEMRFLDDAASLVRHHHERPDGQGYPDGLKGDEISLGSHILNLCDAVDAMTSNRPYRAALSVDQCVAEVLRFRGTQFDTRVVDTFERMVGDGSFVIIEHADGSAQQIQRVLREAAGGFGVLRGTAA